MLTVVLPAGLAVALIATIVTLVLDDDTATAPGDPPAGDNTGRQPPLIGQDHWHAAYEYIVCGEVKPPAPEWSGGIHTHSDGIIHVHPFSAFEEGAGARLVKWFEYGGGVLNNDQVRLPGDSRTYRNGDGCPDGSSGVVQVYVNDQRLPDVDSYIIQDGDFIVVIFGPENEFVRTPLTPPSAPLY